MSTSAYATISACGRYRYTLGRILGNAREGAQASYCVFVMLNPSTADADLDDPTIRRCRFFALRERCDHLVVVNLFAYRATDPAALELVDDPVGPENQLHLHAAVTIPNAKVIVAWGANHMTHRETAGIRDWAHARNITLWCLGRNQDASPKHPLYIRNSKHLEPWG